MRRIVRRHYLLRPDSDGTVQALYWFTTAVIAEKFGILIHAVQMMSTHIHEVLTDTRGMLPAFLRERNRLFANALKCHRGWPEEVFQRAPASCVELYGADAVLGQIGYVLANCVEAGAVSAPELWPGVTVTAGDIGHRVVEVARPTVYFDPKNKQWPERARIQITMPPVLEQTYGAAAREKVQRAVEGAVERARESVRKAGRAITDDIARICAIPCTHRSSSFERFGDRNPTFAAGGNREQAKEALRNRTEFLSRYRIALEAVRSGRTDAPFPDGTWRWRQELVPWASDVRAAA